MNSVIEPDRRKFLRYTFIVASTALVAGRAFPGVASDNNGDEESPEEVSPVEDLMREHGALDRILLIYDEAGRRIQRGADLNPALLTQSAKLIRDFIQGYHEKLEEEYVFPRLKKANRLVTTVDILVAQHRAGRKLTEKILTFSSDAHLKNESDRQVLVSALSAFNRMYRPHEAREDTVVFPDFRKVVTAQEYEALGEQFEEKEHQLFGKDGFEGVVAQIATIEKALGINNLSDFTPSVG